MTLHVVGGQTLRLQDAYPSPDSYDAIYQDFEKPSPFDTIKSMAGNPETKKWEYSDPDWMSSLE